MYAIRSYYGNYGVGETPTEIEFIFDIKDKTYKFYRKVFERTKRTGTVEIVHEVNAFYKENGQFVQFFENPTKTKINELAEKIIGLIV